jgi:hypothetical protein
MKKQVAESIILLILTTLNFTDNRLLGKGKVGIKVGMLTSNILVNCYFRSK